MQDPLANAPLKDKVESMERYLGAGLVQFRLHEAAEQLIRDGRSVYDDQESDSAFAQQTTPTDTLTTKASYPVLGDDTDQRGTAGF
jgi:hypothetical protein